LSKIALFLILIALVLTMPQASAEDVPKIRVLLAQNPSSLEITSDEPFLIRWIVSGSSLELGEQETLKVSLISGSYWIVLEELGIPDALNRVTSLSTFFESTGKPLIGESSGVPAILLGPYSSADQAMAVLNTARVTFPEARLSSFAYALKMEVARSYNLIWGREAPGKAVQFEGTGLIRVNSRRYRGEISLYLSIKDSVGELLVLNELDLESYLYGVVPAEMPFDWPLEALKAQAVASRTYALKRIHEGSSSDLPYDINTTVSDQVYRGYEAEKESANQAVDATRGEVLTYQGELITAAFHSCSGGYTENNENVWKGIAVPYLRGVPSPGEEGSKYFQWSRTVTVSAMTQKIEELKKVALGQITGLEVLERGVSGRIKTLNVIGTTGTCTISGEELRKVADLPSALVNWESNNQLKLFVLSGSGTQEISPNQAFVLSPSGLSPLPKKVGILSFYGLKEEEFSAELEEFLVFTGNGWGHGVGMPQWGAKARAEEGKGYQEILTYYYQGVLVEKEY